jgi:hypothetical protein
MNEIADIINRHVAQIYGGLGHSAVVVPPPVARVKCAKPLDDQITELMRSLPPLLRDRPWTMAELVHRLEGKYRDRPHGQQVGQALLRLGWRRERRWSNGFNGVRVWLRG